MAATTSHIVFDDIFTINAIDKEGRKFDRGMCSFSGSSYLLMPDLSLPPVCPLEKL
jgi:hypothetical protein